MTEIYGFLQPVWIYRYWYVTMYILFVLLSPYLNDLIEYIVIGMAVFWSGVIAETIRQKMQRLFCRLSDKYNRACRR